MNKRREAMLDSFAYEAFRREVAETCGCAACRKDGPHASDCAVHNAPAYPIGPCNCRT